MKPVIIESPYAGEVEKNVAYVRAAMRACLLRGEAPFASHALYTLPGVLDDRIPEERELGMRAGFAIAEALHKAAGAPRIFMVDRGWSSGMCKGVTEATRLVQSVEQRWIPGWMP